MLFSSYEFLLVYLPVTLAGFAVCRARGVRAGQAWLLAASMLFYAWWNPAYLVLLTGSIVVNYGLGQSLSRLRQRSPVASVILLMGLTFNLGLLGYFKYAGFCAEIVRDLFQAEWSLAPVVLPLAISFFTFQQIAYLVDAWRDGCRPGTFLEYALFVQFFPQLIAGPIVQHGDVIEQFRDRGRFRLHWEDASLGMATFVIGLCKKVVLADALAPTANAVFDAAAAGTTIGTADAWLGTLAYTLQLYFDFSGYSDMAIGLGLLFGIRLPLNFDAPYQSASISEFWRRWHITLSRFLRDYLYIPLGGNRCGRLRYSANLMATMLLGGLWHGAGWTFVTWGGLHGLLLVVNHAWSATARQRGWQWTHGLVWQVCARLLTLLSVIMGWVVFRAADLATAGRLLTSLASIGSAGAGDVLADRGTAGAIAVLLVAVQVLPTTPTLVESTGPLRVFGRRAAWLAWRPTPLHGTALALTFLVCITLLTRVREFLYFQF